jgi:hypothetical protein
MAAAPAILLRQFCLHPPLFPPLLPIKLQLPPKPGLNDRAPIVCNAYERGRRREREKREKRNQHSKHSKLINLIVLHLPDIVDFVI